MGGRAVPRPPPRGAQLSGERRLLTRDLRGELLVLRLEHRRLCERGIEPLLDLVLELQLLTPRFLQLLELRRDRLAAGFSARRGILGELALRREVLTRFLDLIGDVRVALVHHRQEGALLGRVADVRRVQHREHRVAEWMDVAVDRESRQRRLQLTDRRCRVFDALAGDLGVVVRVVEGALGRLELGLRALHVRVERLQRALDLTIARLQRVDLGCDESALLAHLLLLALLVVDAAAVSARRKGGRTHTEGDDHGQGATEISTTDAHGEGSSPGNGTRRNRRNLAMIGHSPATVHQGSRRRPGHAGIEITRGSSRSPLARQGRSEACEGPLATATTRARCGTAGLARSARRRARRRSRDDGSPIRAR